METDKQIIADLYGALWELVGEELCGDRNLDNASRETDFYRPVISWATRHRARAALALARGEHPESRVGLDPDAGTLP